MGLKFMRKTALGSEEYWDTEKKKSILVKKGQEPVQETESENANTDEEEANGINIEDMTVKQLREFAEQTGVEIPTDVTKKNDIINYLSEQDEVL